MRAAILRLQLNERFSYDAAQSLFFNNFEEHEVASLEDVETIRTEVETRLHDASVKPHSVVNYDKFAIRPEVLDAYAVRWYFRFQLSSHATCFIRGANIADDQELLKVGSVIYDALYTWCGSLQGERHGWYPATVMQEMKPRTM